MVESTYGIVFEVDLKPHQVFEIKFEIMLTMTYEKVVIVFRCTNKGKLT